jgi:hypothetical protein
MFLFAVAAGAADSNTPGPNAGEVVAKMIQRDNERQSALEGYTAFRRYTLDNAAHHKHAEMTVRVVCTKDGSKQFETVSTTGWGGAKKHVFGRLLDAESDGSRPGARDQSRVTPDNYSFEMAGQDQVNGRPAYVLNVIPKEPEKYLIRGKIWIDTEEYAIVRMEGTPAKNPSFWVKSVHFAHTYEKHGPFWFPASNDSVTDVRIFGNTELKIEYFDYNPNTRTMPVAADAAR